MVEASASIHASLLPELRWQIVSYLDLDDLKQYSLASRMLHAEARSYIWRAIRISPMKQGEGGIGAVADAILRDDIPASSVQKITIQAAIRVDAATAPYPPTIFTSFPRDVQFWARLELALHKLTGLKAVRLAHMYGSPRSGTDVVSPDRLLGVLIKALPSQSIEFFEASLFGHHIVDFCHSWPNLTTLKIPLVLPIRYTLQPHDIPNLRRLEAMVEWITLLAPGRPLERIFQGGSLLGLHDMFGPSVSQLSQILESSPFAEVLSTTCYIDEEDEIPHILPQFSSLSLKFLEMTIFLYLADIRVGEDDTIVSLPQILPLLPFRDNPFNQFPTLRHVRFVLLHRDFYQINKKADPKEFETLRTALKTLLSEQNHPTLRTLHLECRSELPEDFESFWFLATRRVEGDWSVRLVRGKREKMMDIEDDLLDEDVL